MDMNFPKILKIVNLINIFGSSHPIYNNNKFVQQLNKCRKLYKTILLFTVFVGLFQQIQMIYATTNKHNSFKFMLNTTIFISTALTFISILISTELKKNLILKMNDNFFIINKKLESYDNNRSYCSVNIQSFIFIFVVIFMIIFTWVMNIFPIKFCFVVYLMSIYITDGMTIRFVIECFLNVKYLKILKKELQKNLKETENRKILIEDAIIVFRKLHENVIYSKSIICYQVFFFLQINVNIFILLL